MSSVEATEWGDERAPAGSAATTTVTHRYNLLGQRVATDVAADGEPAMPLARYQYNADGSLGETVLGPDGLPRKYRYDPLGELTQIADSAMTETLGYRLPGDQGYGDGNVTQAAYDLHYTDGVSHTYAYSYDPHDRLTAAHNDQAKLAGSSLEAVTYDPNGNIKTERRGNGQTRSFGLAPKTNQVSTVSGDGANAHYAYDAKGRLNGASGESAPDVTALDYDPLNNLPRHVSAGDALEMDYHYDVHNRRVAKVGHRVNSADTTRVYYRGQGAAALTELAGEAAAVEPQTYVRGPGGLQAVTLQGQRYFVSHDHLGSTRALMDTAGKVAVYFNYTPFGTLMPGNSQDDGGLAAHMAYRFAGTEYDTEIGLYNNRARWYDPALGRFLTPDPAHQYPSPYVYVGNNPVNGVDPTGMSTDPPEGWDDGLADGDKGKRKVPQDEEGITSDDDDEYETLEEASEEGDDYAISGRESSEDDSQIGSESLDVRSQYYNRRKLIVSDLKPEELIADGGVDLNRLRYADRLIAPPGHVLLIEFKGVRVDPIKIVGFTIRQASFRRMLRWRILTYLTNGEIERHSDDFELWVKHLAANAVLSDFGPMDHSGFGPIVPTSEMAYRIHRRLRGNYLDIRFYQNLRGLSIEDIRRIPIVRQADILANHVRQSYHMLIYVQFKSFFILRSMRVLRAE